MSAANALRFVSGTSSAEPADATGTEVVDLDDPDAVRRALALHQAGKAVFSVPFNSPGDGTLTWLDPREMHVA